MTMIRPWSFPSVEYGGGTAARKRRTSLRTVHVLARRRMRQLSVGQRLTGEQLKDRQPSAFESVGRTGQVDAPDAEFFLANLATGRVSVGLQPVDPLPQGARVVLAQRLGVDDFQTFRGNALGDSRNMDELSARKDVFLHEIANSAAQAFSAHLILREAVVEHPSAGLENPIDFPEIARKIMRADVFEHTDAGDLVVSGVVWQIGIIDELHANAPDEAQFRNFRADISVLILRQGDAGGADPVILGGPEDQSTPTAADIEEFFVGLQSKLAADVVELLCLSLVNRVGVAFEIGA